MMNGSEVVVEVLLDGDLIIYDPSDFGEEEAALFYSKFEWLDRHYFLATISLTPL